MLKVSGLACSYGAVTVLHCAALDVALGDIVGIIGRNGCGKSTFLRALMGLAPASGSVSVNSSPVVGAPDARVRKVGLSMLPQERRVVRTLTVADNLRLAASSRSGAFRSNLDRWMAALSSGGNQSLGLPWDALSQLAVPIQAKLTVGADRLSGGESACVGLACAVLACGSYLLADEPSAGASHALLDSFAKVLEQLGASRQYAVILAEQNHGFVLRVASRLIVVTWDAKLEASSMVEVSPATLAELRSLDPAPDDLITWLEDAGRVGERRTPNA